MAKQLAERWSAARIRRRRSKQPEHPTLTLEAAERDRELGKAVRRSQTRVAGLAAARKRQAAEKVKGR